MSAVKNPDLGQSCDRGTGSFKIRDRFDGLGTSRYTKILIYILKESFVIL